MLMTAVPIVVVVYWSNNKQASQLASGWTVVEVTIDRKGHNTASSWWEIWWIKGYQNRRQKTRRLWQPTVKQQPQAKYLLCCGSGGSKQVKWKIKSCNGWHQVTAGRNIQNGERPPTAGATYSTNSKQSLMCWSICTRSRANNNRITWRFYATLITHLWHFYFFTFWHPIARDTTPSCWSEQWVVFYALFHLCFGYWFACHARVYVDDGASHKLPYFDSENYLLERRQMQSIIFNQMISRWIFRL